jgi:hypothetical protein
MTAVTLLVMALGALAVIMVRPSRVLIPYTVVLCLYPNYLTVQVATVDFTVARFLIMVVLARLIVVPSIIDRFRFNWLDVFVILAYLGRFFALTWNESMGNMFVREMGTLFDTTLVYFAARLSLVTSQDFVDFVKAMIVAAIPLVALGMYQTLTSHNVWAFSKSLSGWNPHEQHVLNRRGLYRADVSFDLHISFGLFFALMLPLAIGLWHKVSWPPLVKIGTIGLMWLGMVSSMSSGPLFATMFAVGAMCIYRWRQHWFYFVVLGIGFIIAIELYSNRHFPHVLGRFAFSSHNMHYRIGLWEEAFGGGMDDHWMFGYGYVGLGPGNDNSDFHWEHTDFLNIYIARLVAAGLFGLVPYVVMTILPFFALKRAMARAPTEGERWFIWCIIAAYTGWILGFQTVGMLTQIPMLYNLFIGVIANAAFYYAPLPTRAVRTGAPARRRRPITAG